MWLLIATRSIYEITGNRVSIPIAYNIYGYTYMPIYIPNSLSVILLLFVVQESLDLYCHVICNTMFRWSVSGTMIYACCMPPSLSNIIILSLYNSYSWYYSLCVEIAMSYNKRKYINNHAFISVYFDHCIPS